MSDNAPTVHPSAIIEEGASIGRNVTVEPYAIVKKNVTIKDGATIKSFAYIDGYTTIGENTVIWPSASIGTKTQDKKFRGEKTYVNIGRNCEIREFVTINSSCGEESSVEVGNNCLIMAYCHIAHHCQVGDHVIMSNGATLAGHVIVENYANIGGMTGVHQFVSIGEHAMVGGMSRVAYDIPPYTIGGGIPYKFGGLNVVGLKRRDFSFEVRKELAKAFRFIYRSGFKVEEALEKCKELTQVAEFKHWIAFIENSKRGIMTCSGTSELSELSEEEEILSPV